MCAPDRQHSPLSIPCRSGLWRPTADLHAAAHVDDAGHFQALSSTLLIWRALQLLLAGQTADPSYWLDPVRQHSRWNGAETSELLIWDDQGFGDTLQNLSWLPQVASQVQRLHLWLRPELIPLVRQRFSLPSNCALEPMNPQREPWAQGIPQVGTYYLPIVMQAWNKSTRDSGRSYLRGRIRKQGRHRRVSAWSGAQGATRPAAGTQRPGARCTSAGFLPVGPAVAEASSSQFGELAIRGA